MAEVWWNCKIKNDQGEVCYEMEDILVEATFKRSGTSEDGLPLFEQTGGFTFSFEVRNPTRLVSPPKWLEEKLLEAAQADQELHRRLDERALEEWYEENP